MEKLLINSVLGEITEGDIARQNELDELPLDASNSCNFVAGRLVNAACFHL